MISGSDYVNVPIFTEFIQLGDLMAQYSVLFVCLGNICRSPTAEGVFRKLVGEAGRSDEFHIDSAGTGSWHVGRAPDERARKAALNRGIDISRQVARQVRVGDFEDFDYILAMDKDNLRVLEGLAPASDRDKIGLFLDFAPGSGMREVPDPYYGGANGFDDVLDLVEEASRGLLDHIVQKSPD